jgi:beta-ribofuranosylaminobenzene 5'-phosphate synthase
MNDSVTVRAPARLHLGFLDLNGELGRRFGSLGLAIDAYETRLKMRRNPKLRVYGQEAERARQILLRLAAAMADNGTYELSIEDAIPAHRGLGSGTQLALAIAAALQHLNGATGDFRDYVKASERGLRSGAGIGLFSTGGFVVDGGRGAHTGIPPIVARAPFPESWRILLVADTATQGVSGTDEAEAFAALPQFSRAAAGQICRHVLVQVLPALAEQDIEAFGSGIAAIQEIIGDYFAPVQGGSRFRSRAVEALLNELAGAGATGIGQSSWGPSGFAFVSNAEEAGRLVAHALRVNAENHLDIRVAKGLNRGAAIEAHAPAQV